MYMAKYTSISRVKSNRELGVLLETTEGLNQQSPNIISSMQSLIMLKRHFR